MNIILYTEKKSNMFSFSRILTVALIPFFFFILSCSVLFDFTAKTYKVTFNHNYGTPVKTTVMDVKEKANAPILQISRPGYKLLNWNLEAKGTGRVWNFKTDKITEAITLYAQWGPQTHTSGEPEPETPNMANKAFLGWYKSTDFTNIANRIDFSNQPSGTFPIYPKFVDTKGYTITSKGVLTHAPSTATVEIPYNVNNINVQELARGSQTTSIFGTTYTSTSTVVRKVYLPTKNLVSIGQVAFTGNKGLTNITIPGNVAKIKAGAFSNSGLVTVGLSVGLTEIGARAFQVTDITSITIPSTVTSIGEKFIAGFEGIGGISAIAPKVVSVRMNPSSPPIAGRDMFGPASATLSITVPTVALSAYRAATGWSTYASKISGY